MASMTQLALVVAKSAQLGSDSGGQANTAMGQLADHVTRLARRVRARRNSLRPQAADDFVAEAPSHIWGKLDRFERWYYTKLSAEARACTDGDRFTSWCIPVLNNRYTDLVRHQARQVRQEPLNGDEQADLRHGGQGRAPDLDLDPDQRRSLGDWSAMDGVIAFCLAGQWSVVPETLWLAWLDELKLPAMFPPESFRTAPKHKRRGELAAALGMSRNTLDQRWSRLVRKHEHPQN